LSLDGVPDMLFLAATDPHGKDSFLSLTRSRRPVPRHAAWLVLLCVLVLTGCQTLRSGDPAEGTAALRARADSLEARADSLARLVSLRNPLLNSTLWTQTAVEYEGAVRQAYRMAEVMMQRALNDSLWTASLEQAEQGSDTYRAKPPAVVLDVDETVLDNSPYQARLILDDAVYESESWAAWVREEQADPVPGALSFTQAAANRGVQVIYLTNRDASLEAATRANLTALGFPVDDAPDAVLTQGEREGWASKTARRDWVAERYRILLLVGDNFGDFVAEADTSVSARRARGRSFREYWGSRWIVLPNPQYGSWEAALYDFEYGLPRRAPLDAKREHLTPKRSQ